MAGALILIPTLAFFVLHLVRVGAPGHSLRGAILVWAAVVALAILVFSNVPAARFYPRNDALRALQTQLDRLRDQPIKKRQVVFLLQGSSATSAWIKPSLLENLLRKKGFPARVFLLSTTGSGHFERIALLHEWFRQLTEKESREFREARVVLLREVLASYDREPFVGFRENAFGDRSVTYTSPVTVGLMLRAAWLPSEDEAGDFSRRLSLSGLIAGHFLFNVFRVGTIPPLEVPRIAYSNHSSMPAPAETPRRGPGKKTFDYPAAREEFWRKKSAGNRRSIFPELPWLPIRDRAIARELSGWVDDVAYFTTPTSAPVLARMSKSGWPLRARRPINSMEARIPCSRGWMRPDSGVTTSTRHPPERMFTRNGWPIS